ASSKKNSGRGSNTKPKNNDKSKRNQRPPRKKKKEMALPRPTYDGLSGGREGKQESGGVFGWVKKLFD
ncbi:MAG: ATP-dependent helicase, partial [Balneola sp.]